MTSVARILIVDDEEASRYVKARILSRQGYAISEAATGAAALALIEAERPLLVLLDVMLPDTSGIRLCREIKDHYPGTLVLQTSAAFTGARDRAAGLQGGADSYLVEPIEPEELIAQVGSLIRLSRAEQELRALNDQLEERVAERTRQLLEADRHLATERERRARTEEALWHAEKLDAIGQLTGGVAHDFNNLLTVVLGNLDAVEQLAASPEMTRDRLLHLVSGARQAAQDGAQLTRQLLAFSRRDVLRLEVLDANEAVLAFENLLRRAAGERVELVLALGPDPWLLRVDRTRLEAALLNLVVNARDAMPLGGAVRVVTRNRVVAAPGMLPSQATLAVDAPAGDYVQISVHDTGVGMTPEVLAHAFEPFFTTKDVGQGSGLGLSQIYGFVRQSGGFLTVETAPDAGTQLGLFLPRTEATLEPRSAPAEESGAMPLGAETILVVEDNELVLEVAVNAITGLGYRVLLAATAAAALDIIAAGEPFDLLFTDLMLPHRMSGLDLAREARRLRPGLKVLLTSGYAGHFAPDDEEGAEQFPLLAKPYRLNDLARRLREILTETVPVG